MGNLEEKEFTAGMIKSVEYIAQPSGRFIIANRHEIILFSVFLDSYILYGFFLLQPRGTDSGGLFET